MSLRVYWKLNPWPSFTDVVLTSSCFFFFFFYLQLLPETYLRAKGFHSRERQSYDSGVTVLVTEVPGRVEVNSLFSVQTEMSPPFGV